MTAKVVPTLTDAQLGKPVLATLIDATVDSSIKSAINETLNSALLSQLSSASTAAGYPVLAGLIPQMSTADLAASEGLSLRTFVSLQIVLPTDPAEKDAVQAALAKLSSSTTVGDLLGLNLTISRNPLLAPIAKQSGLATLLKASGQLSSNSELVYSFISQYIAFKGPIADFWTSLSRDSEFKMVVPLLQLTLQLGTLTEDNPQLISVLLTQYPGMTSPRALTSLSADDWQKLITARNVPIPASVSGSTPIEQAANYAASIFAMLKQAFPAAYFAQGLVQQLSTSQSAIDKNVVTFLNNAADFDILNTNLSSYISKNSESVFKGIDSSMQSAITSALGSWQRIARVSSDFPTANILMNAGLSSALDIATKPRASFLRQFTPLLGTSAVAETIYSRAQHLAAQTTALYSNLRQSLTTVPTRAVGNVGAQVQQQLNSSNGGLANWQTLFGSVSSCACTDCRSVYSAAAYFVDLLQFLKNSDHNASGKTPLDVLLNRRPDLPFLKLSCVNTNTELPYVDIVNEILETFIINGTPAQSAAHNTPNDATADELSVNPEFTNDSVYSSYLNTAIYPPTLPFDRWLETARTYLNFMGTSLFSVMSSCQTGSDTSAIVKGSPSAIALACEYLNISEAECVILTSKDFSGQTQSPAPKLYEYYGYEGLVTMDGITWTTSDGLAWELDLAGYPAPPASNPPTPLGITNLLNRLAISYTDLVSLIGTHALNPSLTILLQAPAIAQCDLTQTILVDNSRANGTVSDAPTLSLLHRFVRLWKKIGGTIDELDKTITALNAIDIDQQFLVSLAAARQIETSLNLTLLQTLSFWSNLDTDGEDSFYLSLFQNKAVIQPPDLAFQLNYVAPLAAAPTLDLPSPCFPNLVYMSVAGPIDMGWLVAKTPLSMSEFNQLIALAPANHTAFQNAIKSLYQDPASTPEIHEIQWATALPSGLIWNSTTQQLDFTGSMNDDFRSSLNFCNDVAYQAAVDAIYNMRTLWGTSVLDSSTSPGISNHQNTILAALGISAQDLSQIRTYLQLMDPTSPLPPTPLTLTNLSAISRYAFLAQGVGLSVSDLITVIELISIDPFTNQNPTGTLQFIVNVQAIQASAFSISQLNFLYRCIFDPNAGIAPSKASISLLLVSLQMALSSTVNANAMLPDPTGALLLKNLGTLIGSGMASAALGLISGTITYSAPLQALPGIVLPGFVTYDVLSQQLSIVGAMSAAQQIVLVDLSSDPVFLTAVSQLYIASQAGGTVTYSQRIPALLGIVFPVLSSGTITYDNAAQQLRFTGALSSADQSKLLALSSNAIYAAAIASLYQQPITFIESDLFFLDPTKAITSLIENPQNLGTSDKIAYVSGQLMPYLQRAQSESLAAQILCTSLGLDTQIGGLLLNTVLRSQINRAGPDTAMQDFLALIGDGLTAVYFGTIDLSGPALLSRIDSTINFDWGFGLPNPSVTGRPFSIRWTGFFMPQYSESYTLYVKAGDGVRLWANGISQPLIDRWTVQLPIETSTVPAALSLTAGQLCPITIEYYDDTAPGGITLSWSSPSTPKAIIPQTQLFSGQVITSLDPIAASYTLLYKVNVLVTTFALTALDVAYLSKHGQQFAGSDPANPSNQADAIPFDLNLIPLTPSSFRPAMFAQWLRLNALCNMRNAIPGGDAGLLNIFITASSQDPTTQITSSSDLLATAIAQATGWNITDLVALTGTIGFALTYADFVNEAGTNGIGLIRLQACMVLVQRLGISAQQLLTWAEFVSNAAIEEATAADIQNTVKSKYNQTTWVTVGKSLNDGIRCKSRNALIAYILAHAASWNMVAPDDDSPINTADQLYEYFLIDVQMSTCMLTSRIVQANAAVQLFVQRCLLNLEAANSIFSVSPSVIDTTYWEWMQNFRVWQANRQVFFYPENWMVPTLRDDKTPFFKAFESTLLQNPITTDLAEQAYLDYLAALDSVARLDIRGTYWQVSSSGTTSPGGTPDATNDVLHVFGRTPTSPNTYYYRRLLNCTEFQVQQSGGAWTPWELVNVDIHADHLVPVVWDARLYLFWPTITQSADPSAQTIPAVEPNKSYTPPDPVMDLSITLNWSEYKQGTWIPKSTSDPMIFRNFSKSFPSIVTLGGSQLDTSALEFSTWIANDLEGLFIGVYAISPNNPYRFGILGGFSFSHCGVGPTILGFSTFEDDWPVLLPLGCMNSYNTVKVNPNSNALNLVVGIVPPQGGPAFGESSVQLLDLSWSDVPYNLMFPQQFFDSFGLLVPPVYSKLLMQVLPGQPFVYQDAMRTYFVTETFTVPSYVVADANRESLTYGRYQLTATASAVNANSIFTGAASQFSANTSLPQTVGMRTSVPNPMMPPVDSAGTGTSSPPMGLNQFLFSTFFHPHACSFIQTVNRYGLPDLFTLANQASNNDNGVVLGFEASQDGSTVTLSPGVLIAQGHICEITTPTQLTISGSDTHAHNYLHCNYSRVIGGKTVTDPKPYFYFSASSSPTYSGDAFIWNLSGKFSQGSTTAFEQNYAPNTSYIDPSIFPRENVDFSLTGAYSIYNWELFFHMPLLIATQLSANQQFEDAQTWFQYIFNPISNSSDPIPNRYWNFLPFYECAPWDSLAGQAYILLGLAPSLCGADFPNQVSNWKSDPFEPYAIGRLRPIAFRMNVVMAYLNNLIAWGDSLFGQNTRESIAEATQIYVLAKEILGPRPVIIPQRGGSQDYTYNDLETLFGIDNDLSNATVLFENDVPYSTGYGIPANPNLSAALSMASFAPYFCIPPNTTLMGYWDTVDDRLYKIRNCMNIQGVVEQLPLFSPPISPALLVAATAAGVDISSVLSNINASTPFYRFTVMIQKALELCSEVKALGASLLSALEKQNAEAVALLRATQEASLLQAMQQMKEYAVQEAQSNVAALQASLQIATGKQVYYNQLHQTGLIAEENRQQSALKSAATYQQSAIQNFQSAGSDVWIPEFSLGMSGFGGSPTATIAGGGAQMAASDNSTAATAQGNASVQSNKQAQLALKAQWNRRDADWVFQAAQASDEIAQIQTQITAAGFRVQIAQDDQANLQLQIQNAQAITNFLIGKYTNAQLYTWMIGQISTVFFQCYQMAYDLATRAEAAFRFERGLVTSNYIQFGYWDSLKKGLLSGELLYTDLKRLEIAYLESDVREYEISKSISLVLFDPWALISLKETGYCIISLPESFFDMDYPGHYFRRIKTAGLTIPCVTGPYTSVNCTLTLQNSKIRIDNAASSTLDYANDAHFITNYAATQAIATSTGLNDNGMFEVNFRDEKYLPFEGAGLISSWEISMPLDCNAFDFESIVDVILNVRYTARYGGDNLRNIACQSAVLPQPPTQAASASYVPFPSKQTNLTRYFSLRHEFPTDWYKFLHPAETASSQIMALPLTPERFPFQFRGRKIQITQVEILLKFKAIYPPWVSSASTPLGDYASAKALNISLASPTVTSPQPTPLLSAAMFCGGVPYASVALSPAASLSVPQRETPSSSAIPARPGSWSLTIAGKDISSLSQNLQSIIKSGGQSYYFLNADVVDDILIVCHYSAQKPNV